MTKTPPARMTENDKPMSTHELKNAQRLAEYINRRQGVKEPLIQFRKMEH